MKRRINTAVVGVGHLGGFHAQKYAGLKEQGIDLVALVEPRAEERSKKLALPGVVWFTSINEWLAAEASGKVPRAEAVSIATTTDQHCNVGLQLLAAGKHILVEKPLASSLAEGEKLVAAARKANCWLATGQVERHRVVQLYKELKGKPRFIECHRLSSFPARSTDIDVVMDLMIHDIDLMLALVDSPIVSVHASGFPVLTKQADIANARFEFANGCVANLTSSRISMQRTRKFRIFSGDSYLSLDLASGAFEQYRKDPEEQDLAKAISHASGNLHVEDPLRAEILDFADAIREGRPPLVTGEDGLRAMEAADKVIQDINQRLRKFQP